MISDNMTQKPLYYVAFDPTILRNSIAMATPKVPGDQKLFEMCVICKTKSDKVSASYI